MRCSAVLAALNLGPDRLVDGFNHAVQERVFTGQRGQDRLTGVLVDVVLEDLVELHGHVMEDKADALGNEAEIGGLAPDEEEERDVEELAAVVGGGGGLPAIGDPDVRLLAEVGAPGVVVAKKLLAEAAQNGGVEDVDVVRGRREAHLGVGQVEHQVLPLVPDVVVLEAEEEGQPIQEVHVGRPLPVWRLSQVPHRSEGTRHCADLRKPQGRVVCQQVVDGYDVVRLRFRRFGPRLGRRRPLPVAHGIGEI